MTFKDNRQPQTNNSEIAREWIPVHQARSFTGLGNTCLYSHFDINGGAIKTASIKQRNKVRGKRLVSIDSLPCLHRKPRGRRCEMKRMTETMKTPVRGEQAIFQERVSRNLSLRANRIIRNQASEESKLWPNSNTQIADVLLCLAENYGSPVPLNELMRKSHSGAVHSAVSRLGKRGCRIRHIRGGIEIVDGRQLQKSAYELSFEGARHGK